SANDTLEFTYNGTDLSVTLAHGAYTADSLAAALQAAINGAILTQAGPTTGTEVVYHDSGAGSPIEGLVNGASYFIVRTPLNQIELAATHADALAANPKILTLGPNMGAGNGHSFTPTRTGSALTFGPSSVATSIANNQIGFTSNPGLYTGAPVVYHN